MSENVSPIYDPQLRNHVWYEDEIYTGPAGVGQNVPKVNDLVYSVVDNVVIWKRVSDLNIGNYIATLTPLSPPAEHTLSASEIALGVGPGGPSQTPRAYVNSRTVPATLYVDARWPVYGTDTAYAKIFVGTNLGQNGRVISAVYNNSGDYVGENVPMELVANDAYNNNVGVKRLQACKTSANLVDGEVLTVVYYNTSGDVVAKEQVLVENTAFMRSASAGARTVAGIGLDNPFLSNVNAKTLVYPRNLTLQAENLTGVVYYTDGTEVRMPVDGARFSVTGLDAYDSAQVGVSFPLVIKYALDVNEQAYGGLSGEDHVSEIYTLTTATPNRQYEVRLFVYPKWVDATQGYRLTWWLYDANRSLGIDVSPRVTLATDSDAFAPLAYGITQTLKAKINLSDVAGNYNNFVYSQDVNVRLQAPGSFRQNLSTPPNWLVTPTAGHTPMCGAGVFAAYTVLAGNSKKIDLKGVFSVFEEWLAAYYQNALPLVLTPSETQAPNPTHFTLWINGASFQYPIESWNQTLTVTAAAANNDTVYVAFQYAGQSMLELSVVGMPLYQKNDDGSYV